MNFIGNSETFYFIEGSKEELIAFARKDPGHVNVLYVLGRQDDSLLSAIKKDILLELKNNPGRSMRQMALDMGKDAANFSRAARGLELSGLVKTEEGSHGAKKLSLAFDYNFIKVVRDGKCFPIFSLIEDREESVERLMAELELGHPVS